jgi:hypothetical protein
MRCRKKRIKLETVVDEALKLLPRGMDIPCFTQWVDEVFEQNKTLPRPRIYRNHYEEDRTTEIQFEAIQSQASPDATSN